MRCVPAVLVFISAAAAVPAWAATSAPTTGTAAPVATTLTAPQPKATARGAVTTAPRVRPTPGMSVFNRSKNQPIGTGVQCNRNAVTAQQHINPITGQKQADTIVSVTVNPGGGSIPSATNRQQQLDACAHAR